MKTKMFHLFGELSQFSGGKNNRKNTVGCLVRHYFILRVITGDTWSLGECQFTPQQGSEKKRNETS